MRTGGSEIDFCTDFFISTVKVIDYTHKLAMAIKNIKLLL